MKTASITEEKFFNQNRSVFLRYFDSPEQYQALIQAGNWKRMHQIIKDNSSFNFDDWVENHLKTGDLVGFKRA